MVWMLTSLVWKGVSALFTFKPGTYLTGTIRLLQELIFMDHHSERRTPFLSANQTFHFSFSYTLTLKCTVRGSFKMFLNIMFCTFKMHQVNSCHYYLGAIHKLHHTNSMILTTPPYLSQVVTFLRLLLPSVTSHLLQFYNY